ncbi:pentapeptide repeat-containing protein [Nocardia aurantiaca]|uniref:pentapeptide repeat-containing protein n=1 Tax=Nocardia aurantiaca TaxID=2675850 RepID=UPI0018AB459A|nr:pentapeptide repeat-containing protein [Nocardia aurantiaca]
MSTPVPRRRLSRVTGGLRRPEQPPSTPPVPEPDTPGPEPESSPSRLDRLGRGIGRAATWDGWLKLGAVVTAVGVLVGFWFTNHSLQATGKQYEISRQTEITDRFTKAVAALDSPTINSRLGGIYSLEQLAVDSAEVRTTVFEVLSAYIRDKAHIKSPGECDTNQELGEDIRTALTVIGRRKPQSRIEISLTGTCLPNANFSEGNWYDVNFQESNLANANFSNAKFSLPDAPRDDAHTIINMPFRNTVLANSIFSYSDLYGIWFDTADARGARFDRSDMTSARVTGSDLTGAELVGVNFTDACFSQSNLDEADFGEFLNMGVAGIMRVEPQIDTAKFYDDRHQGTQWPASFTPSPDIDDSQPGTVCD